MKTTPASKVLLAVFVLVGSYLVLPELVGSARAGINNNGINNNGVYVNGINNNGINNNGINNNGINNNGINNNGINNNGINNNGINNNGIIYNGINNNGINNNGINNNGINNNGIIYNGINNNGINNNGINNNGINNNGINNNGIVAGLNLENLEGSLVFGNPDVHNALLNLPLTADAITNPGLSSSDPHQQLYRIWGDPFSIQVVQYLWSNAHAGGDDFHYDPCDRTQQGSYGSTTPNAPLSCPINFYGALGICDRGPECTAAVNGPLDANGLPVNQQGQTCRRAGSPVGWVKDLPLSADYVCQHLISGVFMAQINSLGIHNLLSFAAPIVSRDTLAVRSQLTTTSASVPAFHYKYGTEQTVDALLNCDPTNHAGPVNCGWSAGDVGTCTPGDTVKVRLKPGSNVKSVNLMLQVQQGIHALNYPWTPGGQCASTPARPRCVEHGTGPAPTNCFDPYCAVGDFLDAVPNVPPPGDPLQSAGSPDPVACFTCPQSGVFSTQWAPFERLDYSNLNVGTVHFEAAVSTTTCGGQHTVPVGQALLPAPEVVAFPRANLEGYWAGNIFGPGNNNSAYSQCETRLPQAICGAADATPNACLVYPSGYWIGANPGASSGAYLGCIENQVCSLPSDATQYGMCGANGSGVATRCQVGTASCCVPCAAESFDLYSQTAGEASVAAEVQHQLRQSALPDGTTRNSLVGGKFNAYTFGPANNLGWTNMPFDLGTQAMSLAQIVVNTTQDDFVLDTIELEGVVTSWSNQQTLLGNQLNFTSGPVTDQRGLASGLVLVLPVTTGYAALSDTPVVVDDSLVVDGYATQCGGSPGCYRGPSTRALIPDYRAAPIALGFLQNNADATSSCSGAGCRQRVNLISLDQFNSGGVQPAGLSQNASRIQAIQSGGAVAIVVIPTLGSPSNPYSPLFVLSHSGSDHQVRTGASVTLNATTSLPSSFSNLTVPPYYTGTYLSHFATAGYSGAPQAIGGGNVFVNGNLSKFDPGPFAVTPEKLHLVVSGHRPAAPNIAFPNAHMWLSKNWGDTQGYYHKRSCSSDLSTCIANFEGTIESVFPTNTAGCKHLSVDHDPITGQPLGDVDGCSFGNLLGGTAAPATFDDGSGPYPAYGVTTYLPSYNAGPESAYNLDCIAALAPTAVVYGPTEVCANATVTLDASGSSDPQHGSLSFSWDVSTPNPSQGFAPSFTAPSGGGFQAVLLTATNNCGLQGFVNLLVQVDQNTNQPPVAGIAGATRAGSVVTIDGSSSMDPQNYPFTYAWSQVGGRPVQLSDWTAAKPSFTANAGDVLTFQLVVTSNPTAGCLYNGGHLSSPPAIAQVSLPADGSPPVFTLVTQPVGAPTFSFEGSDYHWAIAGVPVQIPFYVEPDPGVGALTAGCDGNYTAVAPEFPQFLPGSPYVITCTFNSPGDSSVQVLATVPGHLPGLLEGPVTVLPQGVSFLDFINFGPPSSTPPSPPGPGQTEVYHFRVLPDPGLASVTATCNGQSAAVTAEGYLPPGYSFSCTNTGGVYHASITVAGPSPITVQLGADPNPDSDGDGIPDSVDAFPCDPTASAVAYAPGLGAHAMVLFENRWPSKGDFDFNDQSVTYNYELHLNASGQVSALRATFNVLSVGAGTHNGFYLRLPGVAPGAATSILRSSNDGVQTSLSPTAGESDLVVEVVADTRSLFDRQDPFINTDPAVAAQQGRTVELLIQFGAAQSLSVSAAPFDLFLTQTVDYSHQIHLPQFAGTPLANPALFGTLDDGSNTGINAGRYYVTKEGVPFALVVPEVTGWPQEFVAIDRVYPDIDAFGASAGATHDDWYLTNVVTSLVWPRPAAVPVPVIIGPDLATADLGCLGIVCGPGTADCNHSSTDGCEANLSTDSANCGACGNTCAAGLTCSLGGCK